MKQKFTATNAGVIAALMTIPELANALTSFGAGAFGLKNEILMVLVPICGIAIIAIGFGCWFGKIAWQWLAGALFGTVLVFGHDQIITLIRSLFSV